MESLATLLGITDPTFTMNVGKYGDPSKNMGDMLNYPDFSPLQYWEMWLKKPEPQVVHAPQLEDLIESITQLGATFKAFMDKLKPSTSLSTLVKGLAGE